VLRKLALQEIRGTGRRRPLFLMFNPFGVHGRLPTPAPRHVGSATVGAPPSLAINEHDMVDKPPWMQDWKINISTRGPSNLAQSLRDWQSGCAYGREKSTNNANNRRSDESLQE
jgi:hypothetical protein